MRQRSEKNGYGCCDLEKFRQWYAAQEKKCMYCGIEEEFLAIFCTRIPATACLQVDRINNRVGYLPGNMGLACYPCNSIMKKTRSLEFVQVVVRAILANNMLDEYHLWNVPVEKRASACMWHQFTSGRTIVHENGRESYQYEMPNSLQYLPDAALRREPEK
jgi:hypothetical protein